MDTIPRTLKSLWKEWSVQFLIVASVVSEIILTVFGSRRRHLTHMTGAFTRFIIWAAYSLSTYTAALALSKLNSEIARDTGNKSKIKPHELEVEALMAPLILLLQGNPDSITAYYIEDNRLGVRQLLHLVVTVGLVIWILISGMPESPHAYLYIPMFIAGVIKYAESVWALRSVYNENISISPEVIDEEKAGPSLFQKLPPDNPLLEMYLRAYYRFDCLKPHHEGCFYNPVFITHPWMSIDDYHPDHAFLTTEIELGFMYDVLYTKSPVLYTRLGITLRFISYFSLLTTIAVFTAFLPTHRNVHEGKGRYSYVALFGVGIIETYEIIRLPFSDWAIVKMIKHHNKRLVSLLLPFLTKLCLHKKRWSNAIGQFNLLDYCLHSKWPLHIRILNFFLRAEKFKRYLQSRHIRLDTDLKSLILENMKKLDRKRGFKPFIKRGKWTRMIHHDQEAFTLGMEIAYKDSTDTTFDKSIITWHIATDICYHSIREESIKCFGSKALSDYMMYHLTNCPYILSLSENTSEMTYRHAYSKLKTLVERNKLVKRGDVLEILTQSELEEDNKTNANMDTVVTRGWNVLADAQRLATELKRREDRWDLISTVWVEMVCYTAYNCRVYHHADILRRGGDIITHIWILLDHKTDKFNSLRFMPHDI